MSANRELKIIGQHTPDGGSCVSDTHAPLKIILLDLGERYKPADEDESAGDFIFFTLASWGALFRRAAKALDFGDLIWEYPADWTSAGRKQDRLYHKAFVRKYYHVLGDEIAKEARRTGEKLTAQSDIFEKKSLKTILHRAGEWKGAGAVHMGAQS